MTLRRSALRAVPETDIVAGQRALESFQWEEAEALFRAALERHESAEAREGLGTALCWLGNIAEALSNLEIAFRLYREASDGRGAARVATRLAVENLDTLGALAVGTGWLGRAREELEGLEPCEEHAWLEIWEAHCAFLIHRDLATAREHLAAGLALAREHGFREAGVFGGGLEGLMLVAQGQIRDGLRQLDRATTAAGSGELRSVETIGQAYCYVLRGCEQVHDFERAAEWLDRAIEVSRRLRVAYFESYCRRHYVILHLWRGAWDEAERDIDGYMRELASIAPAYLPLGTVLLGELRRRQGRHDEALKLFGRAEGSAMAALGRAALALDRGDAEGALGFAERYFRALSPEERVDCAPGWSIQVRAFARLGRLDEARCALGNLREMAELAGTEELAASVRVAEGLIAAAAGDLDEARRAFEDAVYLFERTGCPFEAGRSRIDLAEVLLAAGRDERAREEAGAAAAQLRRLGAAGECSRAEALARAVDVVASAQTDRAPRRTVDGLTPRQVEVLGWLARGLSNREIAERLFVSEFTVKRHVADILTVLDLPSRAAAAAYAARQGLDRAAS